MMKLFLHRTRRRGRNRRIVRLGVMAALGVVMTVGVSACDLFGPFLEVRNETSQELLIFTENPDTGTRVGPGRMISGGGWGARGECIDSDLVVEDLDGNEVARFPGPFCLEDSPWVITEEMIDQNPD